ncbi:choice-of-anchor D domain-containing protein [Acidobacteria bacterium AB60]|nr:choice-of-anchor D domain-containing protein [Acidobacteria bacterium AB60]
MSYLKAILKRAVQGATVLLLAAGMAKAQTQGVVAITAGPATATMPDGSNVPMWGYFCGTGASNATCNSLNPSLAAAPSPTAWSPIVITVPTDATGTASLSISLTNNLTFTPTTVGATANTIPTSLMIVGQVGGGLGSVTASCQPSGSATTSATGSTCAVSPDHSQLSTNAVTWATVGTSPSFTPPPQGPRVQSFGTEVAAGATTTLTWPALKPGTYLIESGTHPSIQVPMGLYGVLVVTQPPTATSGTETAAGCAYPVGAVAPATAATCAAGAGYDGEVALALGEIDPVQNTAVNLAVNTNGFSEFNVWSGQPNQCGNPASTNYGTCYPPAVNYSPLYYTINGVPFNKTNAIGSVMAVTPNIAPAASTTGTVLVRLVNAGLKMHVPSIVGSQVAGATGGTNPLVTGFKVIAEDGNVLPGVPKIKSEVFMAAGKTFDVLINGEQTSSTGTIATYPNALAVFDRELSLSSNAVGHDGGMIAYIGINGGTLPSNPAFKAAQAINDTYNGLSNVCTAAPCPPLVISDPGKGVIANDINVYGVALLQAPTNGTVVLNRNGTFTYTPTGTASTDTFTYCANGTVAAGQCSSGVTATVTLGASTLAADTITCASSTWNSTMATYLAAKTPGVLAACSDKNGLPLTVDVNTIKLPQGSTLKILPDVNGGFTAVAPSAGSYSFTFQAMNSQTLHSTDTTVNLSFPAGSGLTLNVLDGQDKTTQITDYRWIIEEDRTFYVNPACATNPPDKTKCPSWGASGIVPTLGTNFHTSHMPFVAQGCTGPKSCEAGQTVLGSPVVCDVSNGVCRPDPTQAGMTTVLPGQVALDPSKRYYVSILPGDASDPFVAGFGGADCQQGSANANGATCGHGMGGAPIPILCTPTPPATSCNATYGTVTVVTQPTPLPPGELSIMVFEDDFPLNGEQDGGGGVDVISPNEPGLGGFQIHLWDAMGGNGDFTGQMTYDMFNQPLTNSLAGTKDPNNGLDACPVGTNELSATTAGSPTTLTSDPTATGITGMIVTCPKFESDGITLSPLAGQALVKNLMPGRWGVIATPGADRIARGEEWLQTNTLDGQKAHDSFVRVGEPGYFQEYGPASYHVTIGFANPKIINDRHPYVCNNTDPNFSGIKNCVNTLTGRVTGEHLSRTPDERLYSSGSHDTYYWTQCYVSFGDPDGEDFAFAKCNNDGTFTLTGLPDGDWRLTVFDQWNDLLVDGLSTPVALNSNGVATTTNIGDVATTQWETNLYTRTFMDDNKDGVSQSTEDGVSFANVAVRLRDGSLENLLVTDFTGTANFNETFPLFSWYTVETDVTRYKNTGTHVVYDVGGPVDGTCTMGTSGGSATNSTTGYPPCGNSMIAKNLANTAETISLPTALRVPGSVYCANADCTGKSIQNGPATSDPPSACTTTPAAGTTPATTSCSTILSSGRIDNPWMGGVEGWQGFPGQNSFVEFGKEPYAAGENGGIKGHVVYASTRPFDDPQLLVQTQWEPLVPDVRINLYQEGIASDGVTSTLKLVDFTYTSSWDDWAQGFHLAADNVTLVPNMNCPGQAASTGVTPDLFFFSIYDQPNYLDFYNNVQHGGASATALPNNSQFKCYDGMHNWNQVQPAPYDGIYKFPSITAYDPTTGKPKSTNCTICTPDTAVPNTDLFYGTPMLPVGKYVVEVVLPPGYELVKEEDKNILIGDNFIAPATQEFGGLGNVFIIPDQASVAASNQAPGVGYNANNAQNPTQSLGASPENGIVPGFIPEPVWPCVGEARIVPDYISLFPQSKQVAPFAGSTRRLCDRKEVTLGDQMGAIAKFYVYTSTHIAAKFTGGITDDYTSEFDPFSPQFGEKFAPPDLPVSVKDWAGNEISRVYADHWGAYDGMTYSTWEVNPPNPTGYSPSMMVLCMNDPGPIAGPNGTVITDPAFTPGYSQFCYELPFMPGNTAYLDTPVVPTSAFAGAGYNNVDCAYPPMTPAIAEVDSDAGVGPWVPTGSGHTLTITALGDQSVPNNAYIGPSATTAPYNQKMISRHYGFGGTTGKVTIGGVQATVTAWADQSITVSVPTTLGGNTGVPQCAVTQQAQYGGSTAYCGELVITTSTGLQSVDTVTVTIGGKTPTHVAASASIQAAIDAAQPGDMLIIDPTCVTTGATPTAVGCSTSALHAATPTQAITQSAHQEMVIMWKPIRLQGVGSASSTIVATTHPAGKLDPWRQKVACLFGLSIQGTPLSSTNLYDPTGQLTCGSTNGVNWVGFNETYDTGANSPSKGIIQNAQVDPLPLEAIVGWDASQNGNLAQLLQEPTLMGALEGAGITVLAKGVNFPTPPNTPAASAGGTLGSFPTGTSLLSGTVGSTGTYSLGTGDNNRNCHTSNRVTTNPFPSNFMCNPSSIDGVAITQSSQGGGGIYVHGWAHNLQIANNHIYSNAGTLSGGINLGQGEFAPSNLQGSTTNSPPGSCEDGFGARNIPAGQVEPWCENLNVNIHNNNISLNSSTGDELFSGTPAGAGGISICTGSDYYKFNYNWVCGNLTSGDGGGVGHLGVSYNGTISNNTIIFNQSLNPTIPANGGGLLLMGTPDVDTVCGGTIDIDCLDPAAIRSPSDGIGPGLQVNANLIMGNAAESGSGGGLRLQNVNGSDIAAFPRTPNNWWSPSITNNIITNNVAGWDGAGISLYDALNTNIINNTIAFNSTTASAGILFTTIGAPLASSDQGPPTSSTGPNQGNPDPSGAYNCTANNHSTSCPQPAGLVAVENSASLQSSLPVSITCPAYHSLTATGGRLSNATVSNGSCRTYSYPLLLNNIFWDNSAYYIGVGALSNGFQQNVVTLYNAFTTTPAANQTATGQCVGGLSYWDIGVRGDMTVAGHESGLSLLPLYSLFDSSNFVAPYSNGTYGTSAAASGNLTNNGATTPAFVSSYCNGARIPPEAQSTAGGSGWDVPPGIADATVPNPIFSLTPVATVDEGNNWINLRWGPLSLSNSATATPTAAPQLGNYSLRTGISTSNTSEPNFSLVPHLDFFGNARPTTNNTLFDPGAVQYQVPQVPVLAVTPTSLTFSTVQGTTSTAQTLTLRNSGGAAASGINVAISAPFARANAFQGGAGSCGGTLNALSTCTINVVYSPGTGVTSSTGTAAITATGVTVSGSPVALNGTGLAPTHLASVSPNPLAFGNWPAGTTSNSMALTVTNTGNSPLAGGTFTFGGGTPQQFSRPAGAAGGTCGANLAVGASCTINVRFAAGPSSGINYSRTLTVAYTGATVTPTAVTLTGSAVGTNATVTVTPNPLTITDASGVLSNTGVITFTNTAATGGANVAVTNVGVSGAGLIWGFVKSTDNCTGANLAPGASCTVTVTFARIGSIGTHAGAITFTDTAGTQSGVLSGVAQ